MCLYFQSSQIRHIRKKEIGSKLDRKLQKYSNNFNEIFTFFLKSYRSDILTFCGSPVNVEFDINGIEGKMTFRKYDNGQYKGGHIITRHPNIVKGVIIGKKSWVYGSINGLMVL